MKKTLSFIITCLIFNILCGQAPENYYAAAYGKSGRALQESLSQIIGNHQEESYSALWTHFYTTDVKSNGTVWDIYSDLPDGTPPYVFQFGTNQCGNYAEEGDCYNREHSMPKSWFDDAIPMYTDLFHLYPTDGWVNGKRGNFPYGEVSTASWTSQNGSKLGNNSFPGYTGTVFEPIDEFKGDLARTYLYMCTRYMDKSLDYENGATMLEGSQFKPWALALLISWHEADTVSQKEIDRNNAVYNIQGNRNPFIDFPELAGKIFGADSVNAFHPLKITYYAEKHFTLAPNPVKDRLIILSSSERVLVMNLLDMQGRELMTLALPQGNEMLIDLSEFHSGIYFIQISSEKGKEIHKIVKI